MTDKPEANTKYIILRGWNDGNKFFTRYSPDIDYTKLLDGSVAYEILGYAAKMKEAQEFLYGRSFAKTEE